MFNIIFDLDGTLVDSAPDVAAALNQALGSAGRNSISLNVTKGFLGKGAEYLVTRALEHTGGIEGCQQIKNVKTCFIKLYSGDPVNKTKLFPGAAKVLKHLQNKGTQMALCTNKPKETTLPVVNALNLKQFFPIICCGDEVDYPKPDGRHIRSTVAQFKKSNALNIMVGDTDNDILAAHRAQIPSIYVTFGYNNNIDIVPPPTKSIDSFDKFLDAVISIENNYLLP